MFTKLEFYPLSYLNTCASKPIFKEAFPASVYDPSKGVCNKAARNGNSRQTPSEGQQQCLVDVTVQGRK